MGRIPHALALATLTAALAATGAAQAQSQATPARNTEVPSTGQDTNRAPGNSGTEGAGSLNLQHRQQQGAWVNGTWVNDPGTPSTGQDTNRYPGNSGAYYQGRTARDVMSRDDLHVPVNPPPGLSRSDDEENR